MGDLLCKFHVREERYVGWFDGIQAVEQLDCVVLFLNRPGAAAVDYTTNIVPVHAFGFLIDVGYHHALTISNGGYVLVLPCRFHVREEESVWVGFMRCRQSINWIVEYSSLLDLVQRQLIIYPTLYQYMLLGCQDMEAIIMP